MRQETIEFGKIISRFIELFTYNSKENGCGFMTAGPSGSAIYSTVNNLDYEKNPDKWGNFEPVEIIYQDGPNFFLVCTVDVHANGENLVVNIISKRANVNQCVEDASSFKSAIDLIIMQLANEGLENVAEAFKNKLYE